MNNLRSNIWKTKQYSLQGGRPQDTWTPIWLKPWLPAPEWIRCKPKPGKPSPPIPKRMVSGCIVLSGRQEFQGVKCPAKNHSECNNSSKLYIQNIYSGFNDNENSSGNRISSQIENQVINYRIFLPQYGFGRQVQSRTIPVEKYQNLMSSGLQ